MRKKNNVTVTKGNKNVHAIRLYDVFTNKNDKKWFHIFEMSVRDKRQSEVGKDGEIHLRDVLLAIEVYVGTRF